MKHLFSALALALVLASVPALGQSTVNADTHWTTSDGTVLISGQNLTLRDYHFIMVDSPREKVFRFTDARTQASAELDLREAAGMYLTISDRGETMQIVAPASAMRDDKAVAAGLPVPPTSK